MTPSQLKNADIPDKQEKPPFQTGEELILTIDSIAFGGFGVARKNDFVIFVPFVMENEQVRVQIKKIKSRYAEAALSEVMVPSPLRIKAPCPYFTRCGGCSYQHIPYQDQLELKKKQVAEVYRQIVGNQMSVLEETCSSPLSYHYRTKIRMKFINNKKGVRFGYFDYFDHNVLLDVDHCHIASKGLNDYLAKVRENDFAFFKDRNIRSYNLAFMETKNTVVDNLGPNQEVETEVLGKHYTHNRESFFQINHSIFPSLFKILVDLIKRFAPQSETLLDLFCGVGFFGILLSDQVKKIDFVEENKVSFRFLLKNIELNSLKSNSEAWCRPAHKAFASLKKHYDIILIDPPRIGASETVVRQIASLSPNLVIYISCNPATQFRDIRYFFNYGLELVYLKPFDFFPQTKHIETIALFKPVKHK